MFFFLIVVFIFVTYDGIMENKFGKACYMCKFRKKEVDVGEKVRRGRIFHRIVCGEKKRDFLRYIVTARQKREWIDIHEEG